MKKGNLYIISIVPINYKSKEDLEQEQPGLEETSCPYCEQRSWISAKKRALLKEHSENVLSGTKDSLVVMCWDCMKKYAAEIGAPERRDI